MDTMFGKNVSEKLTKTLIKACKVYFEENLPDKSFPEDIRGSLQVTPAGKHGDLTSNIAMRLASAACCSPVVLGEGILLILNDLLEKAGLSVCVDKVELKGGFINFWLSNGYYSRMLQNVYDQKGNFGKSDIGKGQHVNLEYVSANPTGPLTIAHGRQAAIGDALSRILRFCGYKVTNEYYLNDMGRQIRLLGESVAVRYRNLFGDDAPMPEDGYMGDYIAEIAKEIEEKKGDCFVGDLRQKEINTKTLDFFRDYAVEYMMSLIKKDLSDFGVNFDVWTSQKEIEDRNEVEKVINMLEQEEYVYPNEGAKWFASTRFGDDKDRVVIKSDGTYTYLAPDIAYHLNKYKRGFTHIIDLLGPDHHGYIKRMKAAVQAFGHDAKSLDILIVQLVTLMRDGQAVSMSTRKGEFVSLREILDEIGKDVTRFYFLSRRLDSHLDFDIELAKKESTDNPVFYIQYAHARICSIKKYSNSNRAKLASQKTQLELLTAKEEIQLIRKLSGFPFAVKSSAEVLEPNRVIAYLNELARCFHSFYTECRVVSDDLALSKARMFLVECTQNILANGLGLLDITLPEKM